MARKLHSHFLLADFFCLCCCWLCVYALHHIRSPAISHTQTCTNTDTRAHIISHCADYDVILMRLRFRFICYLCFPKDNDINEDRAFFAMLFILAAQCFKSLFCRLFFIVSSRYLTPRTPFYRRTLRERKTSSSIWIAYCLKWE